MASVQSYELVSFLFKCGFKNDRVHPSRERPRYKATALQVDRELVFYTGFPADNKGFLQLKLSLSPSLWYLQLLLTDLRAMCPQHVWKHWRMLEPSFYRWQPQKGLAISFLHTSVLSDWGQFCTENIDSWGVCKCMPLMAKYRIFSW